MKTYEETIAAVLKRRDEYENEKNERRARTIKIAVPAACCLAVAAVVFGIRFALPRTVPVTESTQPKDRRTEFAASVVSKEGVPSGEPVVSAAGESAESAAASSSAPAGAAVPSDAPASAASSVPSGAEIPESTPEITAAPGANAPSENAPIPATVNIPATATIPAPATAPDGRASTATVPAPATAAASSGAPASSAASSTKEDASSTVAPPPDRTAPPDGGNYGEESGGMDVCIPVLPANREIVEVGERITDEEAAAYFAQNLRSLASALSASGVPADSLRVSAKGYSHVCYSGAEGERLEARVNFRDYLVYNGEKLVAIVTLYKENGKLYYTPAFGAAWFDAYDEFLRRHWHEALVYVYAGSAEIILTPDGKVCSPLGGGADASKYFEGVEDPYSLFFHPTAIYIPQ